MKRDALKTKARSIFKKLRAAHPDAHCELNYSNPLELLVATILSAQCTDVRVNIVTKKLFEICKSAQDYIDLPLVKLEKLIQSAGFFRNKARNIQGAARTLVDQFGGVVPKTMEELVSLPGVGRKTANVVLGNAFNLPGLPVDTHVTRLSQRLGLTEATDAVRIEHELSELLPEEDWCMFSHVLIFHGRRVCKARAPQCLECVVNAQCDYYQSAASDIVKIKKQVSNGREASKR